MKASLLPTRAELESENARLRLQLEARADIARRLAKALAEAREALARAEHYAAGLARLED